MRRDVSRLRALVGDAIDENRTEIYYWWLLLALFFEYARPGSFVPAFNAAKLNSVIPMSLFVLALFAPGLRPYGRIFSDRHAGWLVAYLGLILLSVPFVAVTFYAYNVFIKVFGHCIFFLLIARIATSERRLRGIFFVLLVAHLFLIVMNPDVILKPETRAYIDGATFLGDGNDFALSLCILFPMVIELAQSARSRLRAGLAWAAVLVILLAIIGTQSRGASLAAAAVLGFLWLLSKQKVASLIGIIVVGVIVALFASEAYFTRMSTIADYESESSAAARIEAWKAGTRMALDHPLLGVGAGHFPSAFGGKYKPPSGTKWMTAHSMYFLVLGELGLPGIITLCTLVFGGMSATLAVRRRVLNSAKDPPTAQELETARFLYLLAASALGFAVAGAFLSVAYYPHVFVLTGVLISARQIATANLESPVVSGRKGHKSDASGAHGRTARQRAPAVRSR